MATFTKANDWVDYLVEDVDMASDTFMIALSNTAPGSETPDPTADTNGVIANVTQISYTNYTDDMTVDRTLENVSSTQTSGTYTFDADDIVITASGGALADFRYVYLYDDTVTGDPIVGVWDNGSAISLGDGDSVTISWSASGIFTVA